MPTTTIADAVVFPQDPGTSPSGTIVFGSDPPSGGSWALHAAYQSGAGNYVLNGDGGSLAFTVDSANDELTIDPGVCYITQSGGGVSVQSETGSTYGIDLPSTVTIVYAVIVPSAVTVALDADAENTVYVSVDPDTRNSATAHAGNGLGTPADPAIELGTVDSAAGTTVARANDKPDGDYDAIDANAVSANDGTFKALEADSSLSGPTASEGDVVTVESNPDTIPVFFDSATGEPLVPDLENPQ